MPLQDQNEEALIAKAEQGNKQAFAALYELYLNEIYRYMYYRLLDRMEAEDLTEKVFIKAWEALTRPRENRQPLQNFRAWIYRIARNTLIDHQRQAKHVVSMEDIERFQSNRPSLQEQSEINEQAIRLVNTLSQLDETSREVLLLRFVNQLSHADAAVILGISENHVRVLQFRALKKMKVLLDA